MAQAADLRSQGLDYGEISERLGISRLTARRYNANAGGSYGRDCSDKTPKCRCGLRLSTPEERQNGQCSDCIPESAVAYLGRCGDPLASAIGLRSGTF